MENFTKKYTSGTVFNGHMAKHGCIEVLISSIVTKRLTYNGIIIKRQIVLIIGWIQFSKVAATSLFDDLKNFGPPGTSTSARSAFTGHKILL